MKRTALLAVAGLVLTFATACGGSDSSSDGGASSSDRPSVAEISAGLSKGDFGIPATVPDSVVDCIAQAYHDSDVSDETLQAIVDNNMDYKGSDADAKILSSVSQKAATSCASAG